MIQTNWHTHTKRCGHAKGEDHEYVEAAIQAGFKTLGFSDHVPYPIPEEHVRMDYFEYEGYISSIRSLKQKYKDQIDIYVVMEVECFLDQWETLSFFRKELDYLILGQHNLAYHGKDIYNVETPEELLRYCELIETACQHALCDYICHPDVCMWSYPQIDGTVKEIANRIADISLRYNMPVELNCGSGVRYPMKEYEDGFRYAYPTRAFFEVFAEKKCPVVIGLDIHDPKLFLTDDLLNRALSVVEGLDLNFLYDYDLVSAAKERKKLFY